ncbi:hypothetical protein X943_001159 [Babesia divergens]|uniref:Uncharacterized protein n=1 Tax=Babesia divergens TaxID=32595 RepID=A0AAD9GAB3_BABDI|nr:hypothetical protein X943_001159 [Babesia divergens]
MGKAQSMVIFSVWGLVAFLQPTTAFSNVARRQGTKSISTHNEECYSNSADHSTPKLISDPDRYMTQVFGNLLKDEGIDSLITAPLKFFYSRKKDVSEDGELNDKDLQKTVAECVLTHKENSEVLSKTIYLSLRDAEEYGKRLELAKHQKTEEPSIGGIKLGLNDTIKDSVELKCKSVVIEDETKKCNACLYVEVLIPSKHVRYGHVGSASILECLNGYDNGLNPNSADRSYFINSRERYHPVCIL